MKLEALYKACQLAFAANDDKIMIKALKEFEVELNDFRVERNIQDSTSCILLVSHYECPLIEKILPEKEVLL